MTSIAVEWPASSPQNSSDHECSSKNEQNASMCRPFDQTWLLENPFAVDHCGDDYFRLLHGINYAIAVGQEFTNVIIVELRDFAPAMREARQYLGLIDNSSNDDGSVSCRVPRNILRYRFDVLQR